MLLLLHPAFHIEPSNPNKLLKMEKKLLDYNGPDCVFNIFSSIQQNLNICLVSVKFDGNVYVNQHCILALLLW